MNRLLAQQSSLQHRRQQQQNSLRKARTRTLIQAGGLLSQIGLLDYCGIEPGEDLQGDWVKTDKAAVLLGMLQEWYEALPDEPADAQWAHWKSIGIRQLKMQASK